MQLPQVLPRLVPLGQGDDLQFILLEDAISARLPELFGGFDVLSSTTFRITRDSDVELLEQESDDMLRLIEKRFAKRQRGQAVRLEVASDVSESMIRMIVEPEEIKEGDGTCRFVQRAVPHPRAARFDGHDRAGPGSRARAFCAMCRSRRVRRAGVAAPRIYSPPSAGKIYWFIIRSIRSSRWSSSSAARPSIPNVLAIKQTLYRTSGDSPVTRALIAAAENGKHVTALVELKARFDEEPTTSVGRGSSSVPASTSCSAFSISRRTPSCRWWCGRRAMSSAATCIWGPATTTRPRPCCIPIWGYSRLTKISRPTPRHCLTC